MDNEVEKPKEATAEMTPGMAAVLEGIGKLSLGRGDLLVIKTDSLEQDELNALRDHLKIRLGFWPAILGVTTDTDVSVASLDPSIIAPLEERIVALEKQVNDLIAAAAIQHAPPPSP